MNSYRISFLFLFAASILLSGLSTQSGHAKTSDYIPPSAHIFVHVDFASMHATPELHKMLQDLDAEMKQQMIADGVDNVDAMPTLEEFVSVSGALVFKETLDQQPNVFVALQFQRDYTETLAMVAEAEGYVVEEADGRTYFKTNDSVVTSAENGTVFLMGQDMEDVSAMLAAKNGTNINSREDIRVNAAPAENNYMYVHVDGPSSINQQIAAFKFQAMAFAGMALAQAPPEQQADLQLLQEAIPHIFDAQGYELFVGMNKEEMIAQGQGYFATPEAAAFMERATARGLQVLKEEEPQSAEFVDNTMLDSSENMTKMVTRMSREDAVQLIESFTTMMTSNMRSGMY
jgi:hypothetical protein